MHRRQPQLLIARPSTCLRRAAVQVHAKEKTTGNAALDNALDVGKGLVDSAANLVPESVPRPVAKTGVAVVGGLIAFTILQKLISTVLTIALLGGAAWFYFQYSGSDNGSSSKSSGKQDSDVDLDDPLAEARRIMDKYKK